MTLKEYANKGRKYATQIIIMDQNAPMKKDIIKICSIWAREAGHDTNEFVREVALLMQKEHINFEEAVRNVRNAYALRNGSSNCFLKGGG